MKILRWGLAVGIIGIFAVGVSCNSRLQRAHLSDHHSSDAGPLAPQILLDTLTDSPGTNLATRLVKLWAEIGGSPPLLKQWKMNKGAGFVDVSPTATNSTLWITNAQVSDSGLYALFATNIFGRTNTTPQQLIVIEGTD